MTIASPRRSRLIAGVLVMALLGGGLWVLARRGEANQVVDLPRPHQMWLVYAKPTGQPPMGRGPEEIYRAAPDGSDAMPLGTGLDPVLSPDGRWIAFSRPDGSAPGRLFVVPSSGGRPRQFDADGDGGVAWSWNSRLIAATGFGQVTIASLRDGRTRTFAVPQSSRGFTFSPDGRTLAFARSTGSSTDIFALSLPGGEIHPLTTDGQSRAPLWGPRGIAFERDEDVWLMNGDGGHVRRLTHTHAGIYPAAWSANGVRILAAYPATHNGKLYAVNVVQGRARALTGFVGDLSAMGLSRDGKTVLAGRGCGGLATPFGLVETIPFRGGKPTVIVKGPCAASWNG